MAMAAHLHLKLFRGINFIEFQIAMYRNVPFHISSGNNCSSKYTPSVLLEILIASCVTINVSRNVMICMAQVNCRICLGVLKWLVGYFWVD